MDNMFLYVVEKIVNFLESDIFAFIIVALLVVGLIYNAFRVL